MNMDVWFSSVGTLGAVMIKSAGLYLTIIVLTRLFGLRSFSKISSYDFAMTIAIGSIIASGMLFSSVSLLHGIVGLFMIYILQAVVGRLRVEDWLGGAVDNPPLLLMRDGEILEDNLQAAGMSIEDLRGKLREANVLQMDQARAVIFEATGDVSVLHADSADVEVDNWLLKGVRDEV